MAVDVLDRELCSEAEAARRLDVKQATLHEPIVAARGRLISTRHAAGRTSMRVMGRG